MLLKLFFSSSSNCLLLVSNDLWAFMFCCISALEVPPRMRKISSANGNCVSNMRVGDDRETPSTMK